MKPTEDQKQHIEKLEEIFGTEQHGMYHICDFPKETYTHIIEYSILANQNPIIQVPIQGSSKYKRFSKALHHLGYDLDFDYMGYKSKIEIKSIMDSKYNEWNNGTYRCKYFYKDSYLDGYDRRKYQGTTIDLSAIINYPDSSDLIMFFEYIRPAKNLFGYRLLKIMTPDEIILNTTIDKSKSQTGNEPVALLTV